MIHQQDFRITVNLFLFTSLQIWKRDLSCLIQEFGMRISQESVMAIQMILFSRNGIHLSLDILYSKVVQKILWNMTLWILMDVSRDSEAESQRNGLTFLSAFLLKDMDLLVLILSMRLNFILQWNIQKKNLIGFCWNGIQKVMDYGIDVKAVCPSSLPAKYYVEFNSKSNYESPGCLIRDLEPNFEHVKYAVIEPDQFAPTLSYTPKCISLEEDRIAENALYSSNDMFSYGDQHWLKTKVWDGTTKFDTWQKSLYATNIVEEDPPPIFRTWQFPQNETRLFSLPRLQAAREEHIALFPENTFDHHFSSSNIHESFHGFV